tara:strand:- start:1265 stop:2140 length:876 start_codon:yes stop_codon:yes gene_type:complete
MATIQESNPPRNKLRKRRRTFSQSLQETAPNLHFLSQWFDQQLLTFRKFLRKSSARDKLLGTIQYGFQLQRAMLPEDAPQSSALIADAFSNSISDARKGFRLLKWIDEYGKIRKIVMAPSRTVSAMYWKIVPVTMRLCAFGYYLVDNSIWIRQIILSGSYGRKNKNATRWLSTLKRYKNNFSLWRTIIALLWGTRLIGILAWYRPKTSNTDTCNDDGTSKIITTRPWHEVITFHTVLQLRGMMNFLILCKHLGLYSSLSDVWVGRLGMMASMLGMWKHWGVKLDYFLEYRK